MHSNGRFHRESADKPEYVTITFEAGEPVALNGKKLLRLKLIEQLTNIAGNHGVGRIDQ